MNQPEIFTTEWDIKVIDAMLKTLVYLQDKYMLGGNNVKLSKKETLKLNKEVKNMSKSQKRRLEEGAKVEREHTKNKKVEKKISIDNLKEDKSYYKKLKKVGKKKK